MRLIEGQTGHTRAEVWLKAVEYLLSQTNSHEEYNLILHISNPIHGNEKSVFIEKEVNKLLVESDLYSLHTIAETIFPFSQYRMTKQQGVFEEYPNKIYPRIKQAPGNSRGTYAYRILRSVNWRKQECRPLEDIISRLKSQLSKNGTIRMAYELPVSDITDINISRHDTNTRGFPCMSHISFKICPEKERLHATVLYRSQDYGEKALGNLLGVVRLQWFVAKEVGLSVGDLTCMSTFASLSTKGKLTISNLRKLIYDVGEFDER